MDNPPYQAKCHPGENRAGPIKGLPRARRAVRLRDMRFTVANWMTVSRVPAMFVIVWLMNRDFDWAATIAFWLFIAAALTDWFDGMVARARGEVSSFGRF